MPARRQRIRARSAKRSDPDRRAVEAEVRSVVFRRDGGCLLRDGVIEGLAPWGSCMGPDTAHHLLKASQGGDYDEDNLICLCAKHNDMVEDVPVLAALCGLVVRPGRIDHDEAAARRRDVLRAKGKRR